MLRRDRIGFVFQAFNLVPTLTAEENIRLPLAIAGQDADPAWFDTVIDTVGLRARLGHLPKQLSGGQQQRVAIVRSLAVAPRLMLFDEVTSALDPVLVNEVLSAVRDLRGEGMTMVIATHEMGFATQVADEVCFLAGGVIVERGTPDQVIHAPADPRTAEYLRRVHEAGRL